MMVYTRLILLIGIVFAFVGCSDRPQKKWMPVKGKIMTRWAEEVEITNPLNNYPRPQMIRNNWVNLNGIWDYAIKQKSEDQPSTYHGEILVPFAIESSLSGVGKRIGEDSVLWYHTTFNIPSELKNERIILHFGAVDWEAEVHVNDIKVGTHRGGYDAFSFDITEFLKVGNQDLKVRVWDPTDDGPQPRGKQVNNPGGIWYTPVTGIWQTVWLEKVPETYIVNLTNEPNIDEGLVTIRANVLHADRNHRLKIKAFSEGRVIAQQDVNVNEIAQLAIPNQRLWSTSDPYLYDLEVTLTNNGQVIDSVKSYFGMRKISMAPNQNGIQRLMLNNEIVFQFGPLDQGWWPDGLYTAPTDEALRYDIEVTKEMGFNMIRKHVKVEPARWYYHCDKLGMLVWQDMPSGDMGNTWDSRLGIVGAATDKERSKESEEIFYTEWKEIIQELSFFPSIVVWVPFNEAWGQFKTREVVEWTKKRDSTRLVNGASGGSFYSGLQMVYDASDIIDVHNYPDPVMPRADWFGKDQVITLGEYGGLGLPISGHTWQEMDNWGYRTFENKETLFERYSQYIDRLKTLEAEGLSAAVYTQTTDVEVEVNGLITYDRKVIKVDSKRLRSLHTKLLEK